MFKLETVNFTKEKGNREAARKFNVGETSIREWRKEEVAIKCLHRKKRANLSFAQLRVLGKNYRMTWRSRQRNLDYTLNKICVVWILHILAI
jgi:hypothetical protein